MTYDPTLLAQAKAAKAASRKLAGLSTTTKNAALEAIAVALIDRHARTGGMGTRVAFLHPSATGGMLVELVEETGAGDG